MSLIALPSQRTMHGSSALVIGVCFVLSVLIHLGVGIGASSSISAALRTKQSPESAIAIDETPEQPLPDDKPTLGLDSAKAASINWLGVLEDPEVGDAPIADVEQAEFTTQVGDAPETTAPVTPQEPTPPVEQTAEQPTPELREPIEEPKPVPEPEPVQEPIQELPPPVHTEQIELEPEPSEQAPVQVLSQPEPQPEPQPEIEPEPEPNAEPVDEQPTEAELTTQPISQSTSQPQPAIESSIPATAGKDGIVSEKESSASIIKRSEKISYKDLNKPIVGKGFEIITVNPKFPASVRFTELPNNPVLIIRFDGRGRVVKVSFLTEKKREFNTGVTSVDEPLVSAVYQWRAKGKQIEALTIGDPESYIEIPMQITFRTDRMTP
tara:strand:+ start:352 stop:1494 length:1143 start_codon:yes stop_codon:yes gene_type:complete